MAETPLQKIIRLNKSTIKDPNKIMPGQKIKTDDGEVEVKKGDTLSKIAMRKVEKPSKPMPSTVQDPQQRAAAQKKDEAPAPQKAAEPAKEPDKSGREALLNRSMGALHAKVVNNIKRVSDELAKAGIPEITKEEKEKIKDDAKVEAEVEAKKEVASGKTNKGMEKPQKRVQSHDNPHGAIKLKNGTEIVLNPNRIGDQNSPTGYDPTTGTPNYSVGPAKGGIVAHFDDFFGQYITETRPKKGTMTFSEWVHKYRLPATRERKAVKDAQGKIHWRSVPKGGK